MELLDETKKRKLLASLKSSPPSFIAFEFFLEIISPFIIVAPITEVFHDKVLCSFDSNGKSYEKHVKKTDIIAILDYKKGDTGLCGYGGNFIVLLPKKLIDSGNGRYRLE